MSTICPLTVRFAQERAARFEYQSQVGITLVKRFHHFDESGMHIIACHEMPPPKLIHLSCETISRIFLKSAESAGKTRQTRSHNGSDNGILDFPGQRFGILSAEIPNRVPGAQGSYRIFAISLYSGLTLTPRLIDGFCCLTRDANRSIWLHELNVR